MKRHLIFAAVFSAMIMLIPAIPAAFAGGKELPVPPSENTGPVEPAHESFSGPASADDSIPASGTSAYEANENTYKVLDVTSGQVIDVPVKDYVIGAVCAEMPATFESEALKAQAVAAHTYAERQRLRELENPTPELCGAYFSNDTSKYQGYFTLNQAKQYYGENFDMYYKKISDAVGEVCDYVITYDNEPIISAFHSMSPGRTESAENAWGASVDYLVSVDSSADTSAPKYLEETAYESDILREKLTSAFDGIKLGDDVGTWIQIASCSDSGTVLTASVGGKTVTGNEIRTALSLRSACFSVKAEGNSVIFTTKGYGHGVGMSQYGANSMAQNGSTWEEILKHYYVGCEVKALS